jgi:hypothetical protein
LASGPLELVYILVARMGIGRSVLVSSEIALEVK